MMSVDQWVARLLAPLGAWVLVSGLDDLALVAVCAVAWLVRRLRRQTSPLWPGEEQLRSTPEKSVAVLVPMWREHEVVGRMLEHNLAAIRYGNYDFFVGAYPNDESTIEAVRVMEAHHPRVHLAICPHDGPTSKADCLNWIYQHVLLEEERRGLRYEVMVTHDAEDLIHPEALRWINYYTERCDFVQIPVLPLPTPMRDLTHGAYCDEFAEYQTKDMRARQILGAFIPSNGVGTGYRRAALEKLAQAASNRVFEPECLTEDYENGIRLHKMGCTQVFVPVKLVDGKPVATREYFPRTLREAVKQRTRWAMGISLQAWERHGWRGGARLAYWFWRDRKGLIGNPATILSSVILLYGLGTWVWSQAAGSRWGLGQAVQRPATEWLLGATLVLQLVSLAVRVACSGRIYGWRFALGVPVRVAWANWINFVATMLAIFRYGMARVRRQPLVWIKTEHAYPSRAALVEHKRTLEEILVSSSYVGAGDLAEAQATKPPGAGVGEYLVRLGKLTEEELFEAMSLRENVPLAWLEPRSIPGRVARALPARVVRDWRVLPFKIVEGDLYLAGPGLPGEGFESELRRFTRLGVCFQLVTTANFERLREELLGV